MVPVLPFPPNLLFCFNPEIRCQFVFSGKNDELTPDFDDTGFRHRISPSTPDFPIGSFPADGDTGTVARRLLSAPQLLSSDCCIVDSLERVWLSLQLEPVEVISHLHRPIMRELNAEVSTNPALHSVARNVGPGEKSLVPN
jgi:hypothetical protein